MTYMKKANKKEFAKVFLHQIFVLYGICSIEWLCGQDIFGYCQYILKLMDCQVGKSMELNDTFRICIEIQNQWCIYSGAQLVEHVPTNFQLNEINTQLTFLVVVICLCLAWQWWPHCVIMSSSSTHSVYHLQYKHLHTGKTSAMRLNLTMC